MEKLRTIQKSRINQVKNFPSESGLAYEKYGKSKNIKDYSDREITEMIFGIYKDSKNLLVDGDYFINLNNVTAAKCVLKNVSYYKNPSLDDYKTNYHNRIKNIRTFYVKDYFLITNEESGKIKEHKITNFLYKIGCLHQGRNKFQGLYSIGNTYQTLLFGIYPKDLYHPIKRYINGLFFNNDYMISNFIFESDIEIHKGE